VNATRSKPAISDFRKNSLNQHGKGSILGIFRLALGRTAPSGGAQDDRFYFLGNPKNIAGQDGKLRARPTTRRARCNRRRRVFEWGEIYSGLERSDKNK
jgi:hypothetical protein